MQKTLQQYLSSALTICFLCFGLSSHAALIQIDYSSTIESVDTINEDGFRVGDSVLGSIIFDPLVTVR